MLANEPGPGPGPKPSVYGHCQKCKKSAQLFFTQKRQWLVAYHQYCEEYCTGSYLTPLEVEPVKEDTQ